jgi:hypothetical protein
MSKKKRFKQQSNPQPRPQAARFKLAVWTPSLTGTFNVGYVNSILKMQVEAQRVGGKFSWGVVPGISILPVARNRSVVEFLKGDATHFMFLDSDVGVNAQDVMVCVLSGLDFTALPYSRRAFDPARALSIIQGTPGIEPKSIASILARPAFEFHGTEPKEIDPEISELGFVVCDRVGTGAMILRREVFEKMAPIVDEYFDLMNEEQETITTKNFFGYSRKEGYFIGEDWTFCDQWTSLGEKIYLKVDAKTSHEGSIQYGYDFQALADIAAKAKDDAGA